jgi:hypothetical protein
MELKRQEALLINIALHSVLKLSIFLIHKTSHHFPAQFLSREKSLQAKQFTVFQF